ncbi:Membrane protein insertase YidC [Commensalibacter sp. Nvir]|uniref:membrane protein insertase YidC n=1 Tax=Commensalibacter sp. Nvir TaxID=3069817 RepID=UPI002D24735A|nr:Membrane protein insertase YidC [Commensalibacter sp. Nvir]
MDNKRFFLATMLSVLLLFGFQYFLPKKEISNPVVQNSSKTLTQEKQTPLLSQDVKTHYVQNDAGPDVRLAIEADSVQGSINLKGAIFDDLVLKNYRETIKPNSPLVRVLSTVHSKEPNYVETGWIPINSGTIKVPSLSTIWKANHDKLTPSQPVTLSWNNGKGFEFQKIISIDKDFLFKIEQKVINRSDKSASFVFYANVDRAYTPKQLNGYLVHDGPIGIVDHRLEQISYKTARQDSKNSNNVAWSKDTKGGWAGITDKYWLTALIPQQDKDVNVSYKFIAQSDSSAVESDQGIYQVEFTSKAPITVASGETISTIGRIFSGAKEVHLLNHYEKEYQIPDFWKAVDFGWFAFLTYPIFIILDWLNNFWGNFGLALLTFTLIVKTVFYPLASKQFHSMGRMKALQPKMKEIRERFKDDQTLMNQHMMALYKQQGVNPASGCLPIVIQIPIFWCLYKDLYVTIEMRHAPFFGWIHDLSAPDPTNIFNLFGLIPYDPSFISPFLHVGIWPLVFGATMFLQQRLNPAVMDPMQKKMFQFMPLIFTFVLAMQPAGLVIYYSWNNLLTAMQQLVIQKRMAWKEKKAVKG